MLTLRLDAYMFCCRFTNAILYLFCFSDAELMCVSVLYYLNVLMHNWSAYLYYICLNVMILNWNASSVFFYVLTANEVPAAGWGQVLRSWCQLHRWVRAYTCARSNLIYVYSVQSYIEGWLHIVYSIGHIFLFTTCHSCQHIVQFMGYTAYMLYSDIGS